MTEHLDIYEAMVWFISLVCLAGMGLAFFEFFEAIIRWRNGWGKLKFGDYAVLIAGFFLLGFAFLGVSAIVNGWIEVVYRA